MKKNAILVILSIFVLFLTSCAVSFTTVATPSPKKQMIVTSGDLPNKNYEVLGFIESKSSVMGFGLPTEEKMSKMKSEALNMGLVSKAESLGADAVINVSFSSTSKSTYLVFLTTDIIVTGTAIKFK